MSSATVVAVHRERSGRPMPSSLSVQLRMQRQSSRDTPIEVAFRRILHRRGLRVRIHRRPLPAVRRTADLVFTRARVAVYVDGWFWHGCPDHYMEPLANGDCWLPKIEGNRRRDADTAAQLASASWLAFRVWEHEDLDSAVDRLQAILVERVSA